MRRLLRFYDSLLYRLLLPRFVRGKGFEVHGDHWRGLCIGKTTCTPEAFLKVVDDSVNLVQDRVTCDFAHGRSCGRSFRVICYSGEDRYEQAAKDFGKRLLRPFGRLLGTYLPFFRAAFVFTDPATPEFRHALVHELAHAFCDLLLRGRSRPSARWAVEGYACFMEIACAAGEWEIERTYLAYLYDRYRQRTALSLSDLLRSRFDAEDLNESWYRYAHAAVFVQFLDSLHRGREQVWAALRTVIAGRVRRPQQVVELLERAFGATIASIEAQFIDYCFDQVRKLAIDDNSAMIRRPPEYYGQIMTPRFD
jgi:hypothetical protein